MKKTVIIWVVIVIVLTTMAFTGISCKTSTATTTAAEVPVGNAMLSSTWASYIPYMAELVKIDPDFGFRTSWRGCEGDINQQFTDVDNLLQMGVKGIIIDPVDFTAIVPAVQKIVDAKVPVIISNATVDVKGAVPALMDVDKYGRDEAEMVAASINYKGFVCLIQGQVGNYHNDHCTTAFETVMAKYPDIKYVMAPTDWNGVKAAEIMENWMATYSQIDAVWALDDTIAIPALQAMKTKGRLEGTKFFGLGSSMDEAWKALADGDMFGELLSGRTRIAWWLERALDMVMNGRTKPIDPLVVPMVLSEENKKLCLDNGMPTDIVVLTPEQAQEGIANAGKEYGKASIKPEDLK